MRENPPINSNPTTYLQKRAQNIIKSHGVAYLKSQLYSFGPGTSGDTIGRKSYLNTPVFSNLRILPGSYEIEGENGIEVVNYDGLEIDAVLMDISQRKNIVKTQIQGKNGTIKEYVNDGDYQIAIKGILASGEAEIIPEEDLETLIEILKVPESLSVESSFLEYFEIDTIVIDSWKINQDPGYLDNVPFTIQALSDKEITLEVEETTQL